MSLAYTTWPFSVPHCPARPSRTTEGLILYGAMWGRRHRTASGSSLKSAAAGCEPFLASRLTPASCDSGSRPGTMAAGAREQAASCDAFVLSRRLPAPDAPPSRTYPLCLIAKPFPEPSPNHGPVTSWPGLPLRIPSGSVKGAPSRQRSGRGRCDRRGLAVRVGHEHTA